MPKQRPHPYDEAADEILGWLEESTDYFAEALRGGHRAPFSADVDDDQKLEYYRRQVFNANQDGSPNYESPNQTGRDMLLNRVGIKGYTQIMAAVMPGQRPTYETVEPEDETEYDVEYDVPKAPSGY